MLGVGDSVRGFVLAERVAQQRLSTYFLDDSGTRLLQVFEPPTPQRHDDFDAGVQMRRAVSDPAVPELLDDLAVDDSRVLVYAAPRSRPASRILEGGPLPLHRAVEVARQLALILDRLKLDPIWLLRGELDTSAVYVDDDRVTLALPPDLGDERPAALGRFLGPKRSFHLWPWEYIQRLERDERSTVFQVALLLYALATGQHAFRRELEFETAKAVETQDYPTLRGLLGDTTGLSELIHEALSPEPDDRPETLAALAARLETWPESEAYALVTAIERDPDDEAPYLVYADHLQEEGDVRGQLIVLQQAGRTAEGARLLESEPALLGPLARCLARDRRLRGILFDPAPHFVGDWRRRIDVEWFCGFVRSLRFLIAGTYANWMNRLFELQPCASSRFLRELTVGTSGLVSAQEEIRTVLAQAARLGGTIRTLFLGDLHYRTPELVLEEAGELARSFGAVRRLGLRGRRVRTGRLDLAELEELRIQAAGLEEYAVRDLAGSTLPRLERLEVACRGPELTARPESVAELLASLPNLKHVVLGAQSRIWIGAAMDAIHAERGLIERLETLQGITL